MRHAFYTDEDGFKRRTAIPDDVPESEAEWGAPAGPPDVRSLGMERGWPAETLRRLHHQLVARGLFTAVDVHRAGGAEAIRSAITSTLRMDIQAVLALYDDDNA